MAGLRRERLRIACVYPLDDDPAVAASMDRIRFRRMAEALARAGHSVDIIYGGNRIVTLGPRLRRVPIRRIRWDDYDVIKASLHKGFQQLLRQGGGDHPFIVSSLGSAVAARPRAGVHFFGPKHELLLSLQYEIARRARSITFLTDENEDAWLETHGFDSLRLRVPTGVDAVLPPPGADPYRSLGAAGRGVLFAGNIYDDDEQPEVNSIWVSRLNRLGRALKKRGLHLVSMGTGDRSRLDREVLTDLGPVQPDEVWDWQRYAVAGAVLAHGPVQDNESSKIYYYLRTELPTIVEAPVPNRWLVEHTGLGAIVPLDDVDAMADAAADFAGRTQSKNGVADWMAREHSWDERASRYATLFEEVTPRRRETGRVVRQSSRPSRDGRIVLLSPGLSERAVWGERLVLRGLAHALPRVFPRASVEILDIGQLDRLAGEPVDLLVSMATGPRPPWRADDIAERVAGISVLWVVNHPELMSEFSGLPFDGFMTNSRQAVAMLEQSRPTIWAPLGVDRGHRPVPAQKRFRSEVVYLGSGGMGNKQPATTHRYLDPAKQFEFGLWGSNWSQEYWAPVHEDDPEANDWHRYWRGPLAVGEEAALYSSAGVVLGYHEDGQRTWGMWNNRVFEVLASGALLLSDDAAGLAGEFADGLVITGGGDESVELIERMLREPGERRRRAEIGRRLVMERYTYDHAASRLRDHYLALCEGRGLAPMRVDRGAAQAVPESASASASAK